MLRSFVCWAWMLLALVGCGGASYAKATVNGNVTLNGKPVSGGYITFSPASEGQGPVVGAPIEGGRYRCVNTPLGKHRVTFQLQGTPTTIRDAVTGEDHQTFNSVRLAPEFASGVDCEVASGATNRNFDLKTVE